MKKIIFVLAALVSITHTMEKTAGTLMLTASYYALLEMDNEQSSARPNWQKRDKLLIIGVAFNGAGLIALIPQIIKSPLPVFTAGKYISGAFFLAKAATMFRSAKYLSDKMGTRLCPHEQNKIIAQAGLSAGLGLCLIGWAMSDTSE